jgi:hypothetical protein
MPEANPDVESEAPVVGFVSRKLEVPPRSAAFPDTVVRA